jgi:hypothetical protein
MEAVIEWVIQQLSNAWQVAGVQAKMKKRCNATHKSFRAADASEP